MGKYTLPALLIFIGIIGMVYPELAPKEDKFSESRTMATIGAGLVAFGGVMAVVRSQSK